MIIKDTFNARMIKQNGNVIISQDDSLLNVFRWLFDRRFGEQWAEQFGVSVVLSRSYKEEQGQELQGMASKQMGVEGIHHSSGEIGGGSLWISHYQPTSWLSKLSK